MRHRLSPAGALAWEFRHRHRWGLRALGLYLAVLVGTKLVVIAGDVHVAFGNAEQFAVAVVVPITTSFVYLLAVFTYGLSGDLAARASMYPARMFTLPVPTATLVRWPMLLGALSAVGLWIVTRWLSLWPSELSVPYVWPAVLAASLVMWTQALVWMPYGVRGLRVVASVLVLSVIQAVVLIALELKASEWRVVAITAPLIPIAYVVARVAVARARRGVVPDWRVPGVSLRADVAREHRPHGPWSASQAQRWYEWRRHGRVLPAWVAIILPFELLLLWIAGTSAALIVVIILGAFITPIVVASFAAASVSRAGGSASDAYGLASFAAVRPLTDAQLLAAKLRMTVRSALATWAVVLVAIPVALYASGTGRTLLEWARDVTRIIGVARAVVLAVVIVAAMMLSTWRQLVQSLCVGLTGNDRLIRGNVFATLVLASLLGPLAILIVDTRRVGVVWSAMPLILSALVCGKLLAAGWVAARLVRERVLSDRTLLLGASCWTAAVLALYALLSWLSDTPHIARYLVMLIAILSVPLARLSAAPLAIARNRHR